MHPVLAFIIIAGLASGFWVEHQTPDNEFLFVADSPAHTRMRTRLAPQTELMMETVIKQNYDYSCGSAALATLLNFSLGENLTEKQVIHGMLRHGDLYQIKKLRAFSLYDMQRLCNVLGYEAQGYRASPEELKNPEYWPCIVPITFYGYQHFVVFKGIYGNHAVVADPFKGNSSYPLPEFETMWHDRIIFMVSNGPARTNGAAQKNGHDRLRLTEKDLRYVREDTATDIMLHTPPPFSLHPDMETNDIPGEWQFGRPPYY